MRIKSGGNQSRSAVNFIAHPPPRLRVSRARNKIRTLLQYKDTRRCKQTIKYVMYQINLVVFPENYCPCAR